MEIIITICIISIILPIIFKTTDTNVKDDEEIIFEFNKLLTRTILCCTVFFYIISLVAAYSMINSSEDNIWIVVIVFALFGLCSFLVYLLLRNKKIIYYNNILNYYNMFGKKKEFEVNDIEKAIEHPSDGMKLIFKNKKKIKIDTQMNNYPQIKNILDKNNIIYEDKNGNKKPKGW